MLHNVVGTLHGTMGLFNAYCDRVPFVALVGAGPAQKSDRRPYFDWIHTALIQGNLSEGIRSGTISPPRSIVSANRCSMRSTSPRRKQGPTYVALDHQLQERELDEPIELPDFKKFQPPDPDRSGPKRSRAGG